MTPIRVADPVRAVSADRAALDVALGRVLDSGRYVHGPEHAAFEEELAAFLGVAHCAGVASGTDALELALAAVGCTPGDEVIAAANAGGYATAAARKLGCAVRYADVDSVTLGLSRETVEAALTDATRAVVATHLYGQMCDIEGIVELCRGRGIAVVEDCAQAAGARRGGRRAGTFADAAAFSFYPTKNLAAIGDGGAVVTGDSARRRARPRAPPVRLVGEVPRRGRGRLELSSRRAAGGRPARSGSPVSTSGTSGGGRSSAATRRRCRAGAGRFVMSDGEDYVAHLAVIVADDRDRLADALSAAGIGTDVHYPVADYDQPAWRTDARLPVTDHAVAHVLTVPCFPELTDEEVDRRLRSAA